jgi:hypothetical protein
MKSNAMKILLVLAIAVGLTGIAFTSGVAFGYVAPRITASSGEAHPIEFAVPQIVTRDDVTSEVQGDPINFSRRIYP